VLAALYSTCRLFVFPTLYEGAGLPPLEAMASHAPVIASDAPAIKEMVGSAARAVPADDVDAWTRTIIELLENETERNSLAESGAKRAALYSWQRTARETFAVYQSVLGSDPA
jgi:glycosyltransferase involved in cell wall biosynthesis